LTTGYAGTTLEAAASENIRVLAKPYEFRALEVAVRSAVEPPKP
jgi:hypothetical protein